MKKQDAILLLDEDGSRLSYISKEFKKDRDVALLAVESVGEEAIILIDKSLREDKDILNVLGK